MPYLALHAVLVRRRNEELEPERVRKGEKLVAPRRVDSVERLVEQEKRRLRRLHAVAAVEQEFRNGKYQEIVRHRLLAAGPHALHLAVDDASLLVLRHDLELEAEPLAVVEDVGNRVDVRVQDFVPVLLEIVPKLVLVSAGVERVALADKTDESLVFRNRRERKRIAVRSEFPSGELTLDASRQVGDPHQVEVEPAHDLTHEYLLEHLAALLVENALKLVQAPRFVRKHLRKRHAAPVDDADRRAVERKRIRLALLVADALLDLRLRRAGILRELFAKRGKIRSRTGKLRELLRRKLRGILPIRNECGKTRQRRSRARGGLRRLGFARRPCLREAFEPTAHAADPLPRRIRRALFRLQGLFSGRNALFKRSVDPFGTHPDAHVLKLLATCRRRSAALLRARRRERGALVHAAQLRVCRGDGRRFARGIVPRRFEALDKRLHTQTRLIACGAFLRRRLFGPFRLRKTRFGRLFQARLLGRARLRADEARLGIGQKPLAPAEEPRLQRKEISARWTALRRKVPRQQRDGFNVGLLERHQRPEPRRKVVDGHVIRSAAHGNGRRWNGDPTAHRIR